MTSIKKAVAGAVIVLCAAFIFFHCDTPEKDDDSSGNCPSGNQAPMISDVHLAIDGETVYDGMTIEPDQDLYFYLDYSDTDCNLLGGEIFLNWAGQGFVNIAQLFDDFGCEGEYPEQQLGFFKTPSVSGQIEYQIKITDSCGAQSNAISGSFFASYAPKIKDAFWMPNNVAAGEEATLHLKVCDEDDDLQGGAIYLYNQDGAKLITDPIFWTQAGQFSPADDCDHPLDVGVALAPNQTVCVDVHVTDGLGNGSERFENVCIIVN